MRPSPKEIKNIWKWTKKDINELFKPFCINIEKGEGGCGPTNSYAIYLVCMMDIWGSIFRNSFNDRSNGGYRENIKEFLKLLKNFDQELYLYNDNELNNVTDELRNNLVHNYGLRILETQRKEDWPNIDVNVVGPIINKVDNGRWHIDVMRLKNHILKLIEEWLIKFNYL